MTNPNWPYKPELNAQKAKLIARCLSHALVCEAVVITEEEQKYIIHFCSVVGEKAFVEEMTAKVNSAKDSKSWDAIQAYIQQKEEGEEDAPSSME